MQVLIVDDDNFTLNYLMQTLAQKGFDVAVARDGKEALDRLRHGDIHLVFTDWEMPRMNGLELCRAIRREDLAGYVYIVMLTGREGAKAHLEGLDAGADDFLHKPLDLDELTICLKTANRILSLETRDVALFAMAKLAESRDADTGTHVERVQSYTRLLARNLSDQVKAANGIDEEYIRLLYQTSALHDLGKVGIPDSILLKPGKLTEAEYEIMKTHTTLDARTLEAALQRFPSARFLQMARDVALTHHETFDGTGYPGGLSGELIPFCGRIVALADVYDALTSKRVYKEAMSHDQAKSIILSGSGRRFDPEVVAAFERAEVQFILVREQLSDQSIPSIRVPSLPVQDAAQDQELVRPGRILVVEDDPITRRKVAEFLMGQGNIVFQASCLSEAMEVLSQHSPQLIISDWEMPGGDGAELCRNIRQQHTTSPLYFIMLTIHADQETLLGAYKAGVNDFVPKPFKNEELWARVQSGLRTTRLLNQLDHKTKELRTINGQLAAINNRLDRLSITDELTGLHNRRYAMFRLEEQWALTDRYPRPLTIAVIDIDHFKSVNDTHGHEAGDEILKAIASILLKQARTTDTVCRFGGEEFLVIFPAQTILEANIFAQRCRQVVEKHVQTVRGVEIRVTISIGLATRTPTDSQFPDIFKAADEALYAAKAAGRNCIRMAKQEVPINPPKPQPALPDKSNSTPPVNLERIKERCGGDASFAAAVIARFRNQAQAEVSRIADALRSNQIEDLRRYAHNLKSMAAYLSADSASQISAKIEQLARENQSDGLQALTENLRQEIDRVIAWLDEHVPVPMATT